MAIITEILDIIKGGAKVFKSVAEVNSTKVAILNRIKNLKSIEREIDPDVVKRFMTSIIEKASSIKTATGDFLFVIKNAKNESISLVDVISSVRLGEVEKLKDVLSLNKLDRLSTENLKGYLRAKYPDFRLNKYVEVINSLPTKDLYNIKATSSINELFTALESNKTFQKVTDAVVDYMKKRKINRLTSKGLLFTIVIAAPTTVAVITGLYEAANRDAGCWRNYLNNGKLTSCKSSNATCTPFSTVPQDSICTSYPSVHTPGLCKGVSNVNLKNPCRKCDSKALENTPNYIAVSDYVVDSDVYTCVSKPSISELVGQLSADIPEIAKDVLKDTTSVVGKLLSGAKHFIYVIISGVVLVLVLLSVYQYQKSKKKNNDEADPEKIPLLQQVDYDEKQML